jgi:hypothetical protein
MQRRGSDPFSPPKAHPDARSSANPKTVANRRAIHAKVGLEIADHRADCAFRANKCRRLKALRRHPQWPVWSEDRKQAEERRIIRELEAKRDARKRNAELAFIVKEEQEVEEVESDGGPEDAAGNERMSIGSDEGGGGEEGHEFSFIDPGLLLIGAEEPDGVLDEGRNKKRRRTTLRPSEIVSEDDDDDGWHTEDDGLVVTLADAKMEGGKRYFEKLSELEAKAMKADAELTAALAASGSGGSGG